MLDIRSYNKNIYATHVGKQVLHWLPILRIAV